MKTKAGNDARRVKQTILYFKHVSFFRNKLYSNRSFCDALRILLFKYHNILKTIYFLSKLIRACNFVLVLKGLEKTLTFKISLKWIFYILFCNNIDNKCCDGHGLYNFQILKFLDVFMAVNLIHAFFHDTLSYDSLISAHTVSSGLLIAHNKFSIKILTYQAGILYINPRFV